MITLRLRQAVLLRTQAAPGTRIDVRSPSSSRSRPDCIPGNVVHARAHRDRVCPVPRRGEGQRRDLRGPRGVAAAPAPAERDAVAAAVPAGAGGAGDRVPAHEPGLCRAGRRVRDLGVRVLAGRRGGDQRAGGPGPADRPARRGAAGGQDGLGVRDRGRGTRAGGDVRPENRRPAGILLREAQAARAERGRPSAPRTGSCCGPPPRCPARPRTSPRRGRPASPPCSCPSSSRPSWPCTTWSTTRSLPFAPRDCT